MVPYDMEFFIYNSDIKSYEILMTLWMRLQLGTFTALIRKWPFGLCIAVNYCLRERVKRFGLQNLQETVFPYIFSGSVAWISSGISSDPSYIYVFILMSVNKATLKLLFYQNFSIEIFYVEHSWSLQTITNQKYFLTDSQDRPHSLLPWS